MQTLQNIRSRYFYPRPPRGGRLFFFSISVLHVDFYPRPPRGGRRAGQRQRAKKDEFLSTPSARRATVGNSQSGGHAQLFLSTPSARRATRAATGVKADILFLSTPSARRATQGIRGSCVNFIISIHALREEGDRVSLHTFVMWNYFYPRPPRGGRHQLVQQYTFLFQFLSTPSARRATTAATGFLPSIQISIHALREEGDVQCERPGKAGKKFLSTPSARRATRRVLLVGESGLFLSTPSARRATISCKAGRRQCKHFYPRPPRGGRPGRTSITSVC